MKNIKFKVKILMILAFCYLLVQYFSPQIFIGNTSKIRPSFSGELIAHIKYVFNRGYELIFDRYFDKEKLKKELEKTPLIQLGKGVYGRTSNFENKFVSEVVFYENEIEWLVCSYNLIVDERPLVFRMPKTVENPHCLPQSLMENVFR